MSERGIEGARSIDRVAALSDGEYECSAAARLDTYPLQRLLLALLEMHSCLSFRPRNSGNDQGPDPGPLGNLEAAGSIVRGYGR
jgi:hypothetical protein